MEYNNNMTTAEKVKALDNLIFPYFIDASEEKVVEIEEWCDRGFDIEYMRAISRRRGPFL